MPTLSRLDVALILSCCLPARLLAGMPTRWRTGAVFDHATFDVYAQPTTRLTRTATRVPPLPPAWHISASVYKTPLQQAHFFFSPPCAYQPLLTFLRDRTIARWFVGSPARPGQRGHVNGRHDVVSFSRDANTSAFAALCGLDVYLATLYINSGGYSGPSRAKQLLKGGPVSLLPPPTRIYGGFFSDSARTRTLTPVCVTGLKQRQP